MLGERQHPGLYLPRSLLLLLTAFSGLNKCPLFPSTKFHVLECRADFMNDMAFVVSNGFFYFMRSLFVTLPQTITCRLMNATASSGESMTVKSSRSPGLM